MNMRQKAILVIEDHADSRLVMAAVLTVEHYQVITAANGAEGLVLAREHQPGLILLDLSMPVMDGRRFREEQLKDPTIASIPVILVTAQGHQAQHQEIAAQLRADCCILKPVDFEQVLSQVKKYF